MIALSLAQMTDADVGVQLGHSKSLDEIEICLRLGYTSAARPDPPASAI